MSKSNIEKRAEAVEHTLEAFQNMVLGFIPGAHIAQEFLNYRSSLKQKRILEFSDSFKTSLQEISGLELDSSTFTTEEFVDIFESVISKVQTTKSLYKLERFKNILIKQIIDPIDDQLILKHAQILDELTDIQLIILDSMKEHKREINIDFVNHLLNYNKSEKHMYYNYPNSTIEVEVGQQTIRIETIDVDFYVNDLVSKGLLMRNYKEKNEMSLPTMTSTWGTQKQPKPKPKAINLEPVHSITKSGQNFLDIIENS